MREVGRKLQDAIGIFALTAHQPTIQSLGFAPGGQFETTMDINPSVQVRGITLHSGDTGLSIYVRCDLSERFQASFADITMMVADLGGPPRRRQDLRASHPTSSNLRSGHL
ncbi:hypothetical protein BKA67DRAFT_660349 [Truncatella angustata]|uniref:Uncharacterized protein n=1 Tax=Truncatella angustata TaxID=152316 RepID=A0A9P8UG35_9PEZI|nr:uncharacterized protein BKA67DRAFT_660349 [Truncatella angustata]KAH6651550.1 hypothetical protein BKA67DRAFT_660349 [Truncatella angustata]